LTRGVPLSVRVRRRLRGALPALVWLGAVAIAIQLYARHVHGITIVGLASEIGYDVSPTIPGKVRELSVGLGERVEPGQVIARLDDEELLLTLAEAQSELKRVRAELQRERELWDSNHTRWQADSIADSRRFARNVEDARIEWLEAKAKRSEDQIVLHGLDLRLDRTKALKDSQLATARRLDKDRTKRDAIFQRIESQGPVIARLETKYDEAVQRYEDFKARWAGKNPSADVIVKPFQYAIEVQQARIEKVNYAITRLDLKSPIAGKVSEIIRRPGETVAVGEPIVRLIEPIPREVVGWVPERSLLEFGVGDDVVLRRRAEPDKLIRTAVASRGDRLEAVPERLSPRFPQFGIPIRITLPDSVRAVPGEAFDIIKTSPR